MNKLQVDDATLFRKFLADEQNVGLIRAFLPLIIDGVEMASRKSNIVPMKILIEEIEGTTLADEPVFKHFMEKLPRWEGAI